MALHRDIFWVGRQWAVTGYGLQAVDQKQKSRFDIEISRLWDDDLVIAPSAERWFNAEDFCKGLSLARERYPAPGQIEMPGSLQSFEPEPETEPEHAPEPPPRCEPLLPPPVAPAPSEDTWASLAELVKTSTPPRARPAPPPEPVAPSKPGVFTAPAKPLSRFDLPGPIDSSNEASKPACPAFDVRIEGGGRFSKVWRIRLRN